MMLANSPELLSRTSTSEHICLVHKSEGVSPISIGEYYLKKKIMKKETGNF